MNDVRVFIGWSGDDNHRAAFMVKELLEEAGYEAIVGGEWKESFTICEDIFKQIRQCNYGIFFIEKEERYKEGTEELFSRGFNPNVMMELGYMLHKLGAGNIRRVLVDLNPKEMPSDLLGTWTTPLTKQKYSNDEEREASLARLAKEVADDFFKNIKNMKSTASKLTYLDDWWKNSVNIYDYDKAENGISKALIYGLQAAIYSNEYERLYNKLSKIREDILPKSGQDKFNDYYAVSVAAEICNFFTVTKRLSKPLSDIEFSELKKNLNITYEKKIRNDELRAWCEIFRTDKLALLYEFYATNDMADNKKQEYYEDALDLYKNVLRLIKKQVKKDGDENYALLFLGFVHRNISNIHKALMELEPEKKENHYKEYESNCKKSFGCREKLLGYYDIEGNKDDMSYEYVLQEYILAFAEAIHFKADSKQKRKDIEAVKEKFEGWAAKNKARSCIFEKVKKEVEALTIS